MQFHSPLIPARLTKRYKRFLADVTLCSGEEVTAHCANPGSMMGLQDQGLKVWLERNDDPKRKLRYAWKLIELPQGHWVGVDTGLPNRLVRDALIRGVIPSLAAYSGVRPEVKHGENSRIDFLLTEQGLPDCYVEVKSVTLRREGAWAEFPDSVTKRGTRHLEDLTSVVARGQRAVMLYLVQRTDCRAFRLAADLDPAYARAFDRARAAGVEMLCLDTRIDQRGIEIGQALAVDPAAQARP